MPKSVESPSWTTWANSLDRNILLHTNRSHHWFTMLGTCTHGGLFEAKIQRNADSNFVESWEGSNAMQVSMKTWIHIRYRSRREILRWSKYWDSRGSLAARWWLRQRAMRNPPNERKAGMKNRIYRYSRRYQYKSTTVAPQNLEEGFLEPWQHHEDQSARRVRSYARFCHQCWETLAIRYLESSVPFCRVDKW